MLRSVALCLVALLVSPVLADDDSSKSLPNGARLLIDKDGLWVRKGKARALLTKQGVHTFKKLAIDKPTGVVDVDVEDYSCVGKASYRWTLAHLDARLTNATAFGLHQKKSYKLAADGFAKAVALDPAWKIAAYNLASAHTLDAKPDAAIAALAPWLAAEPITTYVKVSSDPELRPLLARPELQNLRAAKPGTVKLSQTEVDGRLAYSPDHKLVALLHTENSWGSSAHERTLEIFDLTTGALVATTPIVLWKESRFDCDGSKGCDLKRAARPVVAKRVEVLQAMLNDLGFVTPKLETVTSAWNEGETKRKAYLPRAKLGVAAVAGDGVARVLHGNTVLATVTGLHQRLEDVAFLEEQRAFVLWSFSSTPEGCDGYPETKVSIVPLKP